MHYSVPFFSYKCGKPTSWSTRLTLFRIAWLKPLLSQKGDTTSILTSQRPPSKRQYHDSSRRVQQDDSSWKITEVLFLPDATSSDPNKQRKFVEICNRYSDCRFLLENDDGSFRLTFDVTRQYTFFTVMEDTELNTEQQVSQSEDKLWVRFAVWISRRLIQLACSATISWLICSLGQRWQRPEWRPA